MHRGVGVIMRKYVLSGLDGGRCGHNHEYAVNQNSCDDEQGKEWVDQNIYGHPSYWIKRVEDPQRIRRRESEYILSFADNHERLKCHYF